MKRLVNVGGQLLKLLRQGYTCTDKSLSERASFGIQLEKAVKDFTDMFLPHMQEEEDVFQPLLVRYFGYEELRLLKNIVIEQHELWKEKLAAAKQSTDNLFEFLSSFVENKDQLQTIVEITCENLMFVQIQKKFMQVPVTLGLGFCIPQE